MLKLLKLSAALSVGALIVSLPQTVFSRPSSQASGNPAVRTSGTGSPFCYMRTQQGTTLNLENLCRADDGSSNSNRAANVPSNPATPRPAAATNPNRIDFTFTGTPSGTNTGANGITNGTNTGGNNSSNGSNTGTTSNLNGTNTGANNSSNGTNTGGTSNFSGTNTGANNSSNGTNTGGTSNLNGTNTGANNSSNGTNTGGTSNLNGTNTGFNNPR